MSARSKKLLVAVLVLSVAGCGSDSANSGNDQPTAPTATTTTAAPHPTSTVAPSTTVTSTTAPTETDPATTAATTLETEVATTVATTVASTADPTGEYVAVASPPAPTQTAPVDAANNHPDGVYYASVSEGGDPPPAPGNVVFELVQLFTGQACIDHFGAEDEDACVGDYGIETDPTSSVEVDLDGVFISVADAATKRNFQISGGELNELLLGGDPAPGSPTDYLYSGFGYLITYQGGVITRLEQWWTP